MYLSPHDWKFLQILSALDVDGKPRFPLLLLRTSFRTVHVALTFDLSLSSFFFFFYNINALQLEVNEEAVIGVISIFSGRLRGIKELLE